MKKFLTVAALIWVFFLLQTSVCPLDCVWLDQTESFSHFGRIHRIYGGIQSRHVDRLCLWAFGRSVCGKRRQPHFPERCYRRPARFLRAAVLYVGYLCGQANRLFYPEDIKLPLMMITAADLCVNFVCYLIMFLMRARLDIGYYLLHIILPEAVYTIVVAFIFYPLLLLLHKWLWCADRGSTE